MEGEHVYVISDLHLGGIPADKTIGDPGFEMCGPFARRALSGFIDHLVERHRAAPRSMRLVINGDFIDFLADGDGLELPGSQREFVAFNADVGLAVAKLKRALERSAEVVTALRRLVESGAGLVILLGNHDLELSLPEVRREFLRELGPGGVEFIFDGEAYASDWFVMEHGNRYDGWNIVDHGGLRALRSAQTRGEDFDFGAPAGSHLVATVMNPLKKRYRFVDLLKPENEAAIPILLAFEPDSRLQIAGIAKLYLAARAAQPKVGVAPAQSRYIAGTDAPDDPELESLRRSYLATEELLRSTSDGGATALIAGREATGWLDSVRGVWHVLRSGGEPIGVMDRLTETLAARKSTITRAFDPESEEPHYLEAARRLAAGRAVVMGHTHLAKYVPLEDGGVYVNTGTWCPTIRLEGIYEPDGSISRPRLHRLLSALADNRLDEVCAHEFCAAHLSRHGATRRASLLRWLPDTGTLETWRTNS
jgi:UDP-2,3-diacylglucosamine pyrophosphatase LpxH